MGRLPSSCRRPARQPDNRLTLELNCQSEDVKSYRRSKRDGGKGEPHLLLPEFRADHLTRGREYGSRQKEKSRPVALPSGVSLAKDKNPARACDVRAARAVGFSLDYRTTGQHGSKSGRNAR
jgi:hypothetical protein